MFPPVASAASCPCTIWLTSSVPTNPAVLYGPPAEAGVKFTADVNGYVTALRFYKGAANTGKHVGHLWTSTGTLLGTATYFNESASGWQTAFSGALRISSGWCARARRG